MDYQIAISLLQLSKKHLLRKHYQKKYSRGIINTFKVKISKKKLCTKLGLFENTFLEILNLHTPVKKEFLRANHALYMTKALRKAIMKRSELKSKYFKNQTVHDFKMYKKQKLL